MATSYSYQYDQAPQDELGKAFEQGGLNAYLAALNAPKDSAASPLSMAAPTPEVQQAKDYWTAATGTAPGMSDQQIAQYIQRNPETYNLDLLSAAESARPSPLSAAPILQPGPTFQPMADVSLTPTGLGSVEPIGSRAFQQFTGQGGLGLEEMNRRITDYLGTSPTEVDVYNRMKQFGVSPEDIERASGKTLDMLYPEVFRPGSVLSSGFGDVTKQLEGSGYYKGVAIPAFNEIYDTEQGPGKSVAQQLADWKANIDRQDLSARAPFGFVETPVYTQPTGDYDPYISGYQSTPATALDYLTKNNPVISNAILGHTSTDARAYKVVNGQLQEVGQDQVTPEDIAQGNAFFMLAGATGGPDRERMSQLYRAEGDNLIPVGDPKMYKGAPKQDPGLMFLDMAASALSFVPGPWQVPAMVYKAARAADQGDWSGVAKIFLPPPIATAVDIYEAIDSKDPWRIANSLMQSDLIPQIGGQKIPGTDFTVNDGIKAARIVNAVSGDQKDLATAIQLAGELSNSPNAALAGKGLKVVQAFESGNMNAAFNAAMDLGKTADKLTNVKVPATNADAAAKAFVDAKNAGASDQDAAAAAADFSGDSFIKGLDPRITGQGIPNDPFADLRVFEGQGGLQQTKLEIDPVSGLPIDPEAGIPRLDVQGESDTPIEEREGADVGTTRTVGGTGTDVTASTPAAQDTLAKLGGILGLGVEDPNAVYRALFGGALGATGDVAVLGFDQLAGARDALEVELFRDDLTDAEREEVSKMYAEVSRQADAAQTAASTSAQDDITAAAQLAAAQAALSGGQPGGGGEPGGGIPGGGTAGGGGGGTDQPIATDITLGSQQGTKPGTGPGIGPGTGPGAGAGTDDGKDKGPGGKDEGKPGTGPGDETGKGPGEGPGEGPGKGPGDGTGDDTGDDTGPGGDGDDTLPGGGGDDTVPGGGGDEPEKITCPPGYHLGPDGKTCVPDEKKEEPPKPPVVTTPPVTTTPPVVTTPPVTTTPRAVLPASQQAGPITGPEIARLQGKMLESKVLRERQLDPLAAMKQRIEEMNSIDPMLAAVMAQRLGLPQPQPETPSYTYGQETSIDDILGLSDKEEPMFAQGGYVEPLRATGGAMNPQFMYRSGGLGTREDFRDGKHVAGDGDGQSDDIPAWLADGEFVFPADVVSALGNGSTKAGTDKLYKMMHEIRSRARSTKEKDLPPPAHKSPLDYLKKGK